MSYIVLKCEISTGCFLWISQSGKKEEKKKPMSEDKKRRAPMVKVGLICYKNPDFASPDKGI